jgi:hypothetical protein
MALAAVEALHFWKIPNIHYWGCVKMTTRGPRAWRSADNHEMTVPNFMENIKTSDIIIWIVFLRQNKILRLSPTAWGNDWGVETIVGYKVDPGDMTDK